jgi:hypothetical protein
MEIFEVEGESADAIRSSEAPAGAPEEICGVGSFLGTTGDRERDDRADLRALSFDRVGTMCKYAAAIGREWRSKSCIAAAVRALRIDPMGLRWSIASGTSSSQNWLRSIFEATLPTRE